jgi:hypothetical protein
MCVCAFRFALFHLSPCFYFVRPLSWVLLPTFLSDCFFLDTFDEFQCRYATSIRLIQGFPSRVSESKSDLSFKSNCDITSIIEQNFFSVLLLKEALNRSASSRAFHRASRNPNLTSPLKVIHCLLAEQPSLRRHFLPGNLHQNAFNHYHSIRLVQGFPTRVSVSKSDLSIKSYQLLTELYCSTLPL